MSKSLAKPAHRPTKPRARAEEKPAPQPARRSRANLWLYLVLLFATVVVYSQTARFDFVNFDDPEYVSDNPHVRIGLTADGLKWAFTSGEAANWFPITRLSHMLDGQLFGLRSGWHHLTNVLFHALATLLLFAFLYRATRAPWPSAVVAFLFALHPLHVESVAWVAERKDVLSTFFWFLALWFYVRYSERPALGRYLTLLAAFCFGLMAKPMIVTLPFVLLLLDMWPLRRKWTLQLIWEKLPFFALSAVAAVATYLVQRGSGAVRELGTFPLGLRVENALVSYAIYIAKMLWPSRLAVFYPYPSAIPWWWAASAGLGIAGITAAVLRWRRAYPYLAVGWLWFLGTLLPVIGLVQVGAQARADRYMYVPMVGLSIMLAWGAADVLHRWPRAKPAITAVAAAACLCCTVLTWVQIRYWKNSGALFQHALDLTERNYLAQHNLGNYLMDIPGRLPDAIAHLEAAQAIQPLSARAHTDLGSALAKMPGRMPDAVAQYEAALRTDPDSPIPHNDLGNAFARIPGRLPQAISEYEAALRIKPDYAEAHNNLGSALARSGRPAEALAQFETALRIDPDYAGAHNNLGNALSDLPGRLPEAISEYEAAVRFKPGYAEAHINLGNALSKAGRLPEAISEYEAALRIEPENWEAHANLGAALSEIPGRLPEAISHYEATLRIEPDSAEVHYNLGVALSKTSGRLTDAIAQFEAALRIKPDYAEAHNNLGFAWAQVPGRSHEAIAEFEAALRIKPDFADAHVNLGVALSAVPGRLPEAVQQLEEALRIKPDPEVRQMLERLRSHS